MRPPIRVGRRESKAFRTPPLPNIFFRFSIECFLCDKSLISDSNRLSFFISDLVKGIFFLHIFRAMELIDFKSEFEADWMNSFFLFFDFSDFRYLRVFICSFICFIF